MSPKVNHCFNEVETSGKSHIHLCLISLQQQSLPCPTKTNGWTNYFAKNACPNIAIVIMMKLHNYKPLDVFSRFVGKPIQSYPCIICSSMNCQWKPKIWRKTWLTWSMSNFGRHPLASSPQNSACPSAKQSWTLSSWLGDVSSWAKWTNPAHHSAFYWNITHLK